MQNQNNINLFLIPKPETEKAGDAELKEKLFDIAERINNAAEFVLIAGKCAARCDFDTSFRDRVCRKLETLIAQLQEDVRELLPSNVIQLNSISKGE